MRDLTKHSVLRHIVTMAAPSAISMAAQIAYQLITLYFVAQVSVSATAGLNVADSFGFIVSALTQVLGVGTAVLIAQAIGRKDQAAANALFNQSLVLSVVLGALTMTFVFLFIDPFLRAVAADMETIDSGSTFILWVLPGCALMLPMAVLGSTLRGMGIIVPTVLTYTLTLLINAILAAVLIAGWGTGVPLGIKGAGLAISISLLVGTVVLGVCFRHVQQYITINRQMMAPEPRQWGHILSIGWPVGADLLLMFLSSAIAYHVIRDFGPSAQAGFGIGSRIMQAISLPAMAIAVAATPIIGQCLGAKNWLRVRKTFSSAVFLGVFTMATVTLLTQFWAGGLVGMFDMDAAAAAVGTIFLEFASWTLVAQALVYTCSSLFQGIGNTLPSLISTGVRLLSFATAAFWISTRPTFRLEDVWLVMIASILGQSLMSVWLVRIEFKARAHAPTP